MRTVIFSALLLFATMPTLARAQDPDAQSAYEAAESFSRCAGFWDWFADMEGALGNVASAQNLHNISNGARISAGYMLSVRHLLLNPDGPPRAYGSWDDFVEPLAEVRYTQLAAALERGDQAMIIAETQFCSEIGSLSQQIVDQLRQDNLQ